jgi:hypothetical protein
MTHGLKVSGQDAWESIDFGCPMKEICPCPFIAKEKTLHPSD